MFKKFQKIFNILIYIFAFFGFIFTLVFIAMQFGLLNVRGAISERNKFYGTVPATDKINGCLGADDSNAEDLSCDWINTAEWSVVHDGLLKDKDIILDVANKTGISPRMIISAVVPEQIRFFTSNRESFKRYFEPYKVLGSLSKFSLGVSGIKQETADKIEEYANDPKSEFYPGENIAELIKYTDDANHDSQLYDRLTDEHDHYYSYLYTAIYLKEIESQWQNAGFDIRQKPEVLVTLFNLGFDASVPKINPKVAGSIISVGGRDYSFGELGSLFYYSSELTDAFAK